MRYRVQQTFHFVLPDNSQGASFFRVILPIRIIEEWEKKRNLFLKNHEPK